MDQLIPFVTVAIALLGTLVLCKYLASREDAAPEKTTDANHEPWQHRAWTDAVPAESNASFADADARQASGPETGLSAEAQPEPTAAKEKSPVPAPPPATQADWTPECDDAVAALISLRIPKREAISLVRQSPGSTAPEILRGALKIRGQGRGQSAPSTNGHTPTPQNLQ